jgi:hypothetical protein
MIADLTSFYRFNNYISLELEINGTDMYMFKFYMMKPNCFQVSHVGYVATDEGLNGEIQPSDIKAVNQRNFFSKIGIKRTYGFAKGDSRSLVDLMNLHAHLCAKDLVYIQQNRLKNKTISVLPENYDWKPSLKQQRYFGNGYMFNYDNSYTVIANTMTSPFPTAELLRGTFYTIIKWNSSTPNFGVKAEIANLRQHYTNLSAQINQLTKSHTPVAHPATTQTTQGYIATVKKEGVLGCFAMDEVNIFDYDMIEMRRRAIEHDMFRRYYQEEIDEQTTRHETTTFRRYTRYNAVYDILKAAGKLPENPTQFPGLFGQLLSLMPKTDVVEKYTLQMQMFLDALHVKYTFVPQSEYASNPKLKRILLQMQIAQSRQILLRQQSAHHLNPLHMNTHSRGEYVRQFPSLQESQLPNPRWQGGRGRGGGRGGGRQKTFGEFIPGRGKGAKNDQKKPEVKSEFYTQTDIHQLQAEVASLKRALNSTTLLALP